MQLSTINNVYQPLFDFGKRANYLGELLSHLSINRCWSHKFRGENKVMTQTWAALLDLLVCARMRSSNRKHTIHLVGTLHCHARVPPNTPSVNWSLGSVGSLDSTSHWSDVGVSFLRAPGSVIGVKEVFLWHVLSSPLHALKWHPAIKPLSSGFYTSYGDDVDGRGTYLVLLSLTLSFILIDRLFSWPNLCALTVCPYEQPHTALIWEGLLVSIMKKGCILKKQIKSTVSGLYVMNWISGARDESHHLRRYLLAGLWLACSWFVLSCSELCTIPFLFGCIHQ